MPYNRKVALDQLTYRLSTNGLPSRYRDTNASFERFTLKSKVVERQRLGERLSSGLELSSAVVEVVGRINDCNARNFTFGGKKQKQMSALSGMHPMRSGFIRGRTFVTFFAISDFAPAKYLSSSENERRREPFPTWLMIFPYFIPDVSSWLS